MQFKSALKKRWEGFWGVWRSLDKTQKVSLAILSFFLLALPVSLLIVVNPIKLFSRASYPVTPPISLPGPTVTPPSPAGVINWNTGYVKFIASGFNIMANGRKFLIKPDPKTPISVHSDPGDPKYTSLEAIWYEGGVEMRFFMYFKSDGKYWWVDEMRTYNGKKPGDWIVYKGIFFKSLVNKEFVGTNLTFYSSGAEASPKERPWILRDLWSRKKSNYIHFDKLMLTPAFRGTTPTPIPTLTPIPSKYPFPTPIASFIPTPGPTCLPRPACLDSVPPCMIPEPVDGWCPVLSPTPVVTPTPIVNRTPEIITTGLADGMVGESYSAYVRGRDGDIGDSLKMLIANLPPGIRNVKCSSDAEIFRGFVNSISCVIEGVPETAGTYRVDAVLFDQKGGVDEKSFALIIKPPRRYRINFPKSPFANIYRDIILRLPALRFR